MLNELIDLFKKSDMEHFPISDCIKKSKENGIMESEKFYTCLIIDTSTPGYYEIEHHCVAYTCEDNNELYLGWLGLDGRVLDNFHKSIHIDRRCVIGFREEKCKKEDLISEWAAYELALEAQWDK